MPRPRRRVRKKKVKKDIGFGVAYIQSTFNNTIITITDQQGNAVCWASAGTAGFKGARKGTPFAAQLAAKEASAKAKEFGVRYVDVKIKGPGAGRESAIRALQAHGMEIKSIRDITPIPHNGCRQRKRRRV
ncbi:MAG: 30S ribosomal protein S11 [Candidatus Aminicenantales bacterium]